MSEVTRVPIIGGPREHWRKGVISDPDGRPDWMGPGEPINARMERPMSGEDLEESNRQIVAACGRAAAARLRVEGVTLYEYLDAWKQKMGISNWNIRVLMTDPEYSTEWELIDNEDQ